jgi:CHAT domain-containing protein
LSGLPFGACSSSNDLVPFTTCQLLTETLPPREINALRRAVNRTLHGAPSAEQLQAAALLRVAVDPHEEGALLSASSYLREAAERETDPKRIASLRSDLSAVHLLLAELLQSPLEIAAALEQALWALELDPELAEPKFNRHLSLVLLGMEGLRNSPSDPWVNELQSRLLASQSSASASKQPAFWFQPEPRIPFLLRRSAWSSPTWKAVSRDSASPPNCPLPIGRIRDQLDIWSRTLDPDQLPALCDSSPDRLFIDLIEAGRTNPARVGEGWLAFREANSSLHSFKLDDCRKHLGRLYAGDPIVPLVLEARWVEATIAYLTNRYDESLSIIESLASKAEKRGYFELMARSLRLGAVIYQVRGDYDKSFEFLDRAHEAAVRSGYSAIQAAVLTLFVEQQELVGREEEAWTSAALALRGLDLSAQKLQRIGCLQIVARLALRRRMSRVALKAHELAIELSRELERTILSSSLRYRGELYADLGLLKESRLDLSEAQEILDVSQIDPAVASTIQSDLKFLEGRVAADLTVRRMAAEDALEAFRKSEYGRQQVFASYALAQAQKALGEIDAAIATLQGAMSELSQITSKVSWIDANALVEAARPVADELIGLELDYRSKEEVLATLGRYLALRSGKAAEEMGPPEGQRLVYFVRSEEVVILLESPRGLELFRCKQDRARIERLRETLLIELRAGVPQGRLNKTTAALAEILLKPIVTSLEADGHLAIILDDILAGVPFVLLPLGPGDELMIDRFAISYSTDLRTMPRLQLGQRALIVGSDAVEGDLDRLTAIQGEVRGVGHSYSSPLTLERNAATAQRVREELQTATSVGHFAAHFVVNPRLPLRSYFVLEPGPTESGHLTLQDLLEGSQANFDLLYLSGCDTGSGLPTSAQGFRSLAQAFSTAKVSWTILSLLPLNDSLGAQIIITTVRNCEPEHHIFSSSTNQIRTSHTNPANLSQLVWRMNETTSLQVPGF